MANEITKPFKWRDRHGVFHDVSEMDTSYVFNTLKMIWNNVVSEEYRIAPVYLYDFGPFYTTEYMATAVSALIDELSKRTDVRMFQLIALSIMNEHTKALTDVPFQLENKG